MTVAVVVEY